MTRAALRPKSFTGPVNTGPLHAGTIPGRFCSLSLRCNL